MTTSWFRVGTISTTNNQTTVTGKDTKWLSHLSPIAAGDMLTLDFHHFYEVVDVTSDTELTLDRVFSEATATNKTYAIIRNGSSTFSARTAAAVQKSLSWYENNFSQLDKLVTEDFQIIVDNLDTIIDAGVYIPQMADQLAKIKEVEKQTKQHKIAAELAQTATELVQTEVEASLLVADEKIELVSGQVVAVEKQVVAVEVALEQVKATVADSNGILAEVVTVSDQAISDMTSIYDSLSATTNIYKNVAKGIAATTNGELFLVVSDKESGFSDLYLNDNRTGDYQGKTTVDYKYVEQLSIETLTSGFKKYNNGFKGDGLTNSIYFKGDALTAIKVSKAVKIEDGLIPKTCCIYNRLAAGDGVNVEANNAESLLDKTIICGFIYRANTKPSKNISATRNGAYFIADDYGSQCVAPNLYLAWYKYTVTDSTYANADFGTYIRSVSDVEYAFAPFLAASTDKDINATEIDIFNFKESSQTLLDVLAAESIADFANAPAGCVYTKSDNADILNIVQNGSTYQLQDQTANIGYMFYNFDDNPYNKYIMLSYYVHYDSRVRCRGSVSLLFRDNDKSVFIDNDSAEYSYTKTAISDTVDRVDVRFKYYANYTLAGIGIQVLVYTSVGDFTVSIFGVTLAISNEKFKTQATIAPSTFSPLGASITGATLFNPYINKQEILGAFDGKKVAWLGTSIPHGCRYPSGVSSHMGMSLHDLTIGGGHLTAFNYDSTPTISNRVLYNFTSVKTEIEARFQGMIGKIVDPDDYSKEKSGGVELTQDLIDALTRHNVESVLDPIIADIDVIICDYGINDRAVENAPVYPNKWALAVDAGDDRSNFAGAFSWLYKRCYAANNKIQFIMITHHNRSIQEQTINVVDSQLDVAKFWGVPILDFAQTSNLNYLNLRQYTDGWGLHPPSGGELDTKYERQIISMMRGL